MVELNQLKKQAPSLSASPAILEALDISLSIHFLGSIRVNIPFDRRRFTFFYFAQRLRLSTVLVTERSGGGPVRPELARYLQISSHQISATCIPNQQGRTRRQKTRDHSTPKHNPHHSQLPCTEYSGDSLVAISISSHPSPNIFDPNFEP